MEDVRKPGDSGWLGHRGSGALGFEHPSVFLTCYGSRGSAIYTKDGADTEHQYLKTDLEREIRNQAQATLQTASRQLEERSAELRDRVSEIGAAAEPTRERVRVLEETVAQQRELLDRQQVELDELRAQLALLVQKVDNRGTE